MYVGSGFAALIFIIIVVVILTVIVVTVACVRKKMKEVIMNGTHTYKIIFGTQQ